MEPKIEREILDRLEVEALLTRYATAVDTRDWELYRSCFTKDAVIDYTAAGGIRGGLEEVVAWMAQVMPFFAMTQHLVMNKEIRITGDTATSRCAFYNPMGVPNGKGGMNLFFEGGYYNDRLIRAHPGWRIIERIEETAYSTRLHPVMPPMSGETEPPG